MADMSDRVFRPSEAYKLEDPERLVWLPPAEVVAALGLHPGMMVADIGSGTGYFTLPMAAAVAPEGKIFAVDFQPELLALIAGKLRPAAAPRNVVLVEGTAADTHLAAASTQLALVANVWHELDDHAAARQEIERILAPGGRLAILDWRSELEPPPGPPRHHRIPAADVRRSLTGAGWECAPSQQAGQYHYLLLASPPPR